MTDPSQLEAAARLAIAAAIGLGVGVEREWSGHATGPGGRFAGVRTFFLLGILGGAAGLLAAHDLAVEGALVAGAAFALSIVAYVMAVRRRTGDLDGTTETSALVVIALGLIAGAGWKMLAAGAGSIVVLALKEKTWLHSFIARFEEQELRASLQFAALAVVVLPLLPEGPYFGTLDIHPRALWTVVLIFTGVSFAGHLARKYIGAERGYAVAGALGGCVSSTAIALTFSRQSAKQPRVATPLALGVIAASAVLPIRVIVVSAVLNPDVAKFLLALILPQTVIGAAVVLLMHLRSKSTAHTGAMEESGNPLRLGRSLVMALAFQAALIGLNLAKARWGEQGVYATGAVLGLTDMDALTFSMNRQGASIGAEIAARVIGVGIIANATLKLGCALALGAPELKRIATIGFVALMIGGVGALLLF